MSVTVGETKQTSSQRSQSGVARSMWGASLCSRARTVANAAAASRRSSQSVVGSSCHDVSSSWRSVGVAMDHFHNHHNVIERQARATRLYSTVRSESVREWLAHRRGGGQRPVLSISARREMKCRLLPDHVVLLPTVPDAPTSAWGSTRARLTIGLLLPCKNEWIS